MYSCNDVDINISGSPERHFITTQRHEIDYIVLYQQYFGLITAEKA